jgi:ribonuclease Z
MLQFDHRRYLIGNIGEGLQRALLQRGSKLAKTEHVFVTGLTNWRSVGGVIGVFLTLADVIAVKRECMNRSRSKFKDVPDVLTLHGGKNLTHFMATNRRFVFRKGMPVEINEITEESDGKRKEGDFSPTWKDDNLMVLAMPISPEPSPRQGRKRSYDMLGEEVMTNSKEATEEDEDANNQIRKGVVSSMFNSDWRLDALKKIKLAEVKLPAAIFQRNSEGKIEEYDGPLPGGSEAVPDIDVLVRNPWPGAMIKTLPPTTPSTTSICYIFKFYPQRGKFNAEMAIKLGLKAGPQFKTLTSGQPVTTSNGTVVTPEMVIGKGRKSLGIAVVELPTRSYIDNLVSRKEWSSEEIMDSLEAIIWILGKGVLGDERLSNFMRKHAKLRHEISSPDLCPNCLALESPATAAINLNILDPDRFPIPAYDSDVPLETQKHTELYNRAQVGMTFELVPSFKVDTSQILDPLDTAEVIRNFPQDVLELANEARKTINDPAYIDKLNDLQKDLPGKDVEVITLGTGSALPSKLRNVSSTMIRVPGYGNYLFDCGENTLGQLKRVFGAELPQILRDLKVIWISHLHADHHLGVVAVIKAFHEEMTSYDPTSTKKLMVASDEPVLSFLSEYAEIEDYGYSRIDPLYINWTADQHAKFTPSQISTYGVSSIQACNVDHCHRSLAVVFTFPHGFKVAYSGDCRPSASFAQIGKGATLLIHEATFGDELAGSAVAKKHCTTSEALNVGLQMGARRILLTHFSQRYPKIPVLDEIGVSEAAVGEKTEEMVQVDGRGRKKDQIVIIGFDYMRCLVGDFAKVAAFMPALMKLYEGENEE